MFSCICRWFFCPKVEGHCTHLKGLRPRWVFSWVRRLPFWLKEKGHCSHLKGLRPRWMFSWLRKSFLVLKAEGHCWHLKGLFARWRRSCDWRLPSAHQGKMQFTDFTFMRNFLILDVNFFVRFEAPFGFVPSVTSHAIKHIFDVFWLFTRILTTLIAWLIWLYFKGRARV